MNKRQQEILTEINKRVKSFLKDNKVLYKFTKTIKNNSHGYKSYSSLYSIVCDYTNTDTLAGLILWSFHWQMYNTKDGTTIIWSDIHSKYCKFYDNELKPLINEFNDIKGKPSAK